MHGCHRSWKLPLLLVGTLAAITPAGVMATILEVDQGGGGDYTSIQPAIDAAVPGQDSVFVHCGVYVENIVMRGQIDVTGAGPLCAVIDGNQSGSVVTMKDLGVGVVLQGFTIRNGESGLGGGIYIEASAPTITDNVIRDNSAVVTDALTGYGGGIHITSAVGAKSDTAPIITGNVIRDNSAETYGGGMEIYMDDGSWIANNVFKGNTAVEGGGAIDSFISHPSIVNNTIVRNCLQGGGSACLQGGGGILLTDSAVVEMANNAIVWNEAAAGGGGVDHVGSTINFVSNNAFENLPDNYSPPREDPTGSDGNISLDPLFVDEVCSCDGYQPRSDSPMVDAGSETLAPLKDIREVVRPLDGDVNGVAQPDIGARENEGVTRLDFNSPTGLSWDASGNSWALFNLYRGDFGALRDTGEYTQDPGVTAGARQWCGLSSLSEVDTDEPNESQMFFYLVVQEEIIEGTLGFDGGSAERPFTEANRCP